jgi:GAF domain-containing protein
LQASTPWRLAIQALAALISETGRPARIDDLTDLADGTANVAHDIDIGCVAGAPIIVDGELWGVMATGSADPEPLPPDIEDRLAGFTELRRRQSPQPKRARICGG